MPGVLIPTAINERFSANKTLDWNHSCGAIDFAVYESLWLS